MKKLELQILMQVEVAHFSFKNKMTAVLDGEQTLHEGFLMYTKNKC